MSAITHNKIDLLERLSTVPFFCGSPTGHITNSDEQQRPNDCEDTQHNKHGLPGVRFYFYYLLKLEIDEDVSNQNAENQFNQNTDLLKIIIV